MLLLSNNLPHLLDINIKYIPIKYPFQLYIHFNNICWISISNTYQLYIYISILTIYPYLSISTMDIELLLYLIVVYNQQSTSTLLLQYLRAYSYHITSALIIIIIIIICISILFPRISLQYFRDLAHLLDRRLLLAHWPQRC